MEPFSDRWGTNEHSDPPIYMSALTWEKGRHLHGRMVWSAAQALHSAWDSQRVEVRTSDGCVYVGRSRGSGGDTHFVVLETDEGKIHINPSQVTSYRFT